MLGPSRARKCQNMRLDGSSPLQHTQVIPRQLIEVSSSARRPKTNAHHERVAQFADVVTARLVVQDVLAPFFLHSRWKGLAQGLTEK